MFAFALRVLAALACRTLAAVAFAAGRSHALGQFGTGYFNLERALDILQAVAVALADEGYGTALPSGARRASDAVHIVLGIVRRIVVDDHGDVVDVDAAGHDVGGHQKVNLLRPEELHHLVAFGLLQVGVHGPCVVTLPLEHDGQFLDLLLR